MIAARRPLSGRTDKLVALPTWPERLGKLFNSLRRRPYLLALEGGSVGGDPLAQGHGIASDDLEEVAGHVELRLAGGDGLEELEDAVDLPLGHAHTHERFLGGLVRHLHVANVGADGSAHGGSELVTEGRRRRRDGDGAVAEAARLREERRGGGANVSDGDGVVRHGGWDRAVERLLALHARRVAVVVVHEHGQAHDGVVQAARLHRRLDGRELAPEDRVLALGGAHGEHENAPHAGALHRVERVQRELRALVVARHHDEGARRAGEARLEALGRAHVAGDDLDAAELAEGRLRLLGARVAHHGDDARAAGALGEGVHRSGADIARRAEHDDALAADAAADAGAHGC
mmetsp:Transcript_41718/g.130693  ORF Transcript_41718/g.130693 Transcript_41718/m.130693 type:complete len:347 (+) Transcript_41718:268-1308(+)